MGERTGADPTRETPSREWLMKRVAFYARECERQGEIIERYQREFPDLRQQRDVGKLIERIDASIQQIRELPSILACSQLQLLQDVKTALSATPQLQTERCFSCHQLMPAGWCGKCHQPTEMLARLIGRLRQMSDEQNTRQQAVFGVADIKDAAEREDVLASAADKLTKLAASEADAQALRSQHEQMAQALRKARTFIEYARYELQPGDLQIGDQFPRQGCADKEIARINAALAAGGAGK